MTEIESGTQLRTTIRPTDPCRDAVNQATQLIEAAQSALERADELLTSLPTETITPAVAHLQDLLLASRTTRGVVLDLLAFLRRIEPPRPLIRQLEVPDLSEWLETSEVHQQ